MKNMITPEEFREKLKSGEIIFEKGRYMLAVHKGRMPITVNESMGVGALPDEPINKRVKNAQKSIAQDGTPTDSRLEAYMYDLLKSEGIPFFYHHRFVLQPGFIQKGKKIREITWTADFYFEKLGMVVDTKGYSTEIATMKVKMFRYVYRDLDVRLLRTKLEVRAFIQEIHDTENSKRDPYP